MAALFDTHTHLDHPKFDADRDQVLARARAAGVRLMMVIGSSLATSRRALALAEQIPGCYCAVGVHPHDAREWGPEAAAALRELARSPRVRAIGEVGLDYYYNFSSRDDQFRAFRDQIRLARELGLPLIIHDRDAHADVLRVLAEEGAQEVGGILHCWSAGWAEAEEALALGFCLGFGGSVTFPRNEAVREVARRVPLDRMVIETDCPFLAPVPRRGQRNEPAFVRDVAAFLADLRGLTLADLAQATWANGCRVLHIPPEEAAEAGDS